MSKIANEHRAVVDAFAHLSADITAAPSEADAQRLRSFTASALRAQLRRDPSLQALPPAATRLSQVVPESARAGLIQDLDALDEREAAVERADETLVDAHVIIRRDPRAMLLPGALVDSLTGLAPGERLGPFATQGGIDIWFDVYFAARRMEVRETGVGAPDIVFTQARLPVIRRATTTIDIEPGTVWIRGALIDGALPASTFVGIKVTGGSLKLGQNATINGDTVETAAPLKGVLQLAPAADQVTPVAGACAASDAQLTLPDSLTFKFDAGTSTAQGTAGTAQAWSQQFKFGPSTGAWTFIPRLWKVVLGYDVGPQQFDANPIGDDLVHFEGTSDVTGAGLGLPVVVAADPAILGETAQAASWLLQLKQLTARWYNPDPRPHQLAQAWLAISGFGSTIVADAIAPLVPPVTQVFELWTVAGGSGKRLPWRQTYAAPFLLFYRCNVVDGEDLLVQGQADVALDRPVTTDGVPVSTPTTQGTLLLHRFNGTITALLGALIDDKQATLQFALRNALVWTGTPALIFVHGELLTPGPAQIDVGTAQLLFGVYDWAPTLPDPYVANAFIRRPRKGAEVPQSLLLARVAWSAPDLVLLTFEGQLGPRLALGGRNASSGEPRPAPKHGRDPDVGPTQVEQDLRTFDREQGLAWRQTQDNEQKKRGRRDEIAQAENKKNTAIIDRYMTEVAGPASSLLLLDVSTNQDLLGVAFGGQAKRDANGNPLGLTAGSGAFPVSGLAVHSEVAGMRIIALPQVQWEPVRTLDADQDIMTMGWFPTPLAAANDGGATQIGARYQKLMPIIPEDALRGTFDAYKDGTSVGVRTTFPFGLVGVIRLQPQETPDRKPDLYALTRPKFSDEQAVGGIQVTAHAEGGRPDLGGISPTFEGQLRQWLNGVDLASGAPLGISVLGSTGDPAGSVEKVFNNDMGANPRVPVTRLDLSGYGGSNFSDWNNPFAAFAEAAKVQFRYMIGRTALEVIKVNSVLHPWGVRVTRSVTIERRPGGGVIRRDSGWQAFTPGIFDYRYADNAGNIIVAPYLFDAGVFRGLFNVRNIRPAPGTVFTHGTAQLVPYYADADVALEGMSGRTVGIGILAYLQTAPNEVPAGADALQALIEMQGAVGGPVDTWIDFGGSGLPFRAQRVEVGLAMSGPNPLFVATVRGVPSLPKTGAWSVVTRPVASVPPNGGEAVPVAENRGVPVIRRYPVRYAAGDHNSYSAPRLDPGGGPPGDYRFADAADLLTPAAPANDYALLQSTPTHAFLFPRPFVPAASAPRLEGGYKSALADIYARSTSKGAFPPPGNTIEMTAGSNHFDVGPGGKLALSPAVSINGYPTPLRLAGSTGHGSTLIYDTATITLELEEDRWEAEFTGLRLWSDISGLERISGSEMRIVGSTEQRPQIAEIKTLVLQEIEDILQYIPLFGARGTQGPIDLGASNAKHEFKVEVTLKLTVPPPAVIATFPAGSGVKLTLSVKQSTGIDLATGGPKASAIFGAELEGKVPLLSVGVATVFLIVTGQVTFSLTSVSGSVTAEKLELMAFVGVGVEGKIGPFKAYAFLGVGFVLVYDAIAHLTKYGGLVALEAGVDLTIVQVKIRAELKGLVYKDAGATKCDYSGSVKIQVDIFLIFSISASYQVTDTTSF
jgi:hypothetical protein